MCLGSKRTTVPHKFIFNDLRWKLIKNSTTLTIKKVNGLTKRMTNLKLRN